MPESPFKFLDSYTKDDKDIFFGRDREIEKMYQKVFESKMLLVYGISGTGKTSLINCGLANKFEDSDWLPVSVRRGRNVLESLERELGKVSISEDRSERKRGGEDEKMRRGEDEKRRKGEEERRQIIKILQSVYLDHFKPIYLIFDQFEELFIFGDREEREEFIQIVKSVVDSDVQCKFIFSIREEYLAGVTEFEAVIPEFLANRMRIEKMTSKNAIQVIEGPCKVQNIEVEEGFPEALLQKLNPDSNEIELTYLQVFLDKIFHLSTVNKVTQSGSERTNNGKHSIPSSISFNIPLLEKIGDVSDLLGNFLEEQISALDDPDTGLVLLKSFVSVKGTKQPMKPEETREYMLTLGKDIPDDIIKELIQTFVNRRILCDKDHNGRYELRHDALAAKIYEKFTLAEKELLEVRKYVENAYYTFENRGIFLKKDDLDYLAVYENRLILPKHLQDFINQSRQKLVFQQKIMNRITRISLLVFILIIAAVVRFYLISKSNARDERLLGMFLLQSESNPYSSLKNTLKLWEKYNTSTVLHKMILNNFQKLLISKVDTTDPVFMLQEDMKLKILISPIVKAMISKEGKYIYGGMENKQVFIYNLLTGRTNYLKVDGDLVNFKLSERDSLIALIYENNKGIVCDFMGRRIYDFTVTRNSLMNERLVCFFPAGDYHLAAVKEDGASIYNINGDILFDLKGHNNKVNSIDISPDGRFIVTASCDKKCYIWNFNREINQYSVYDSLKGHNDTVWSCKFNRTGKYIITASADSTIRIWDINGRETNAEFSFGYNYQETRRYKLKYGEYDEDIEDPNLSPYYRKVCNATFSKDELSVVATGYIYSNDTSGNKLAEYNHVMYFDINSKFNKYHYTPFAEIAYIEDEKIIPEIFNRLILSPTGEIAAGVNIQTNKIYVIAPDGLQLITQDGNYAMFSNDDKYLFFINKNSISKFPVNVMEIKELLTKYKITESTDANKGLKMVL